MTSPRSRTAGAGISGLSMLALLLASGALAQDTASDSDVANAAETPVLEDRDALEPAVSSAALAADVSRRQSGGRVMDSLELGRTEITGNQELPKVLYIVPWRPADPGDLMGRPVNTLLDEVLAPLDRDEFVRTVSFYDDLYRDDAGRD